MKTYKVIGLMSGTSLDGLDLAYCYFSDNDNQWEYKILKTREIGYSPSWYDRLKNAIHLPAVDLLQLHSEYGVWLGEQTKQFIKNEKLTPELIASHGHTSHHRPELGFTFQLGSGQHLANTTGIPTISDFRSQDIALGGQGAPLVPIGDCMLFKEYDYCLNLGGISNVSYDNNGKRVAFDIGLANMPLNYLSQKMGKPYDQNGIIAKSGTVNQDLLNDLNALAYYDLPSPKSTSYEWFLQEIVPLLETNQSTIADQMCTMVMHNAQQIARTLHSVKTGTASVLVTGGGAFNPYFMQLLQNALGKDFTLVVPSPTLIGYKEALVFALMGVLRLTNQTNVLCSVTGSQSDSSCGVAYFPN